MKTLIIALLLVMLFGVVGSAFVDETFKDYNGSVNCSWQENITIDIPEYTTIRFYDDLFQIDIEYKLISNTTMILKTPIEIIIPCIGQCWEATSSIAFPKGTKIIIGD